MESKYRTVRALLRNSGRPDDEAIRVLLDVCQPPGDTVWPDFVTHDDKVYRNTLTTLWGARVYSEVPSSPGRISEEKWDELAKGS